MVHLAPSLAQAAAIPDRGNEELFVRYAQELDANLGQFFTRRNFDFILDREDRAGPSDLRRSWPVRISYLQWDNRGDAAPGQTASQKPVIVILPGIFSNARHVDYTSLYASKTHDVVAVDWPGQGESGTLPNYHDYNFANHAKIVRKLLDTDLKDREVVLYGSSFGAMIAYEMADQDSAYFNRRISRYVTIDQGPDNGEAATRRPWRAIDHKSFETMADMIQGMKTFFATHGDPAPEHYCSHIAYQSFMTDPRTGRLVWKLDQNVLNGFHEQLAQTPMMYWDTAEKITVPWLFVYGQFSDTVCGETPDRIGKRPNVDMMMIPETGHVPGMYHPQQVGVVCRWIETPSQAVLNIGNNVSAFAKDQHAFPRASALDRLDAGLTYAEKLCSMPPPEPIFKPNEMRTAGQIVEAKRLGLA